MSDTPDFTGLPPRPDPQTGQPFPPHGRGWAVPDRKPEDNPSRETRLSHKPEPPPGKGPVLAWHKENKRGKITMFLGSATFFIVAGTILAAIEGDPPLEWVQFWQLWAVILVGSLLITRPLSYFRFSAGADWFQAEIIRFGVTIRKRTLDLYELRNIKVTTGPAAVYLELEDDTNFVDFARVYWQSDRRIWDLVYNGILHSVAAGAEVDRNARGLLELDHVPELRYPHGPRQIDVTALTDLQVWELMEDPTVRRLCEAIDFHGSTARFREKFPEFSEDMLTNPANPKWFSTDTNSPDTPANDERPR